MNTCLVHLPGFHLLENQTNLMCPFNGTADHIPSLLSSWGQIVLSRSLFRPVASHGPCGTQPQHSHNTVTAHSPSTDPAQTQRSAQTQHGPIAVHGSGSAPSLLSVHSHITVKWSVPCRHNLNFFLFPSRWEGHGLRGRVCVCVGGGMGHSPLVHSLRPHAHQSFSCSFPVLFWMLVSKCHLHASRHTASKTALH